jgi:phosphoserine aminotransferase
MLYAEIDGSGFYRSPLAPSDRSLVSVRFHLSNAGLETQFLKEAEENGLLYLKGHPAVGGLRASLYNTVPEEAAAALAAFMADFRSRRG